MPTTYVERGDLDTERLTARCQACGDPFMLNRPWQTHCSTRCRRRMEKRRERGKLKRTSVDAPQAVAGISSRERELLVSLPRRPAGRIMPLFDPQQFDTIVGFVDSKGDDVPEQFWPHRSRWSRYL